MQPDAQKAYVFDEPLTTPTLTTKSGAITTATTAGSPTTSTRTTSEGEACNGRITDCVNEASEAPSSATPSSNGGGFALLYVTEVSISLSQIKSEISEEEKEQVYSYIGSAVSEAPLQQSGNDQQPNLKENLLNVKVTGFFKK